MPSSIGWSPVSRPFAGLSREAAPNDWVQREERYALAMEALDEGVYDWNIELDQIYLSPQLRLMLGMSADEPLSSETGKGTDFVVLMSGEPQGGIKMRRRSPGPNFGYARAGDRLPYWRWPHVGPFSRW